MAAILNISECSTFIFTPPTENDPWDIYLDESSEKNSLYKKKGSMKKTHLAPGLNPKSVHVPSTVPLHWEKHIEEQLLEDVRMGVLE